MIPLSRKTDKGKSWDIIQEEKKRKKASDKGMEEVVHACIYISCIRIIS